jgi:molecular chaperone DnaK (HSP70)
MFSRYVSQSGEAKQTISIAEKALKDAGDKVSSETKKSVEDAIAKLNEVKSGSDIEVIKKEIENLSTTMQKIGEEMAKNTSATEAPNETGDAQSENSESSESK